jgi:hypothetical protein
MSQFLEYVNVTLHGKRNFADMTELSILRWEDYFGLPNEINVTIGLYER